MARGRTSIGLRTLQRLCAETIVSVRNRKAMTEDDIAAHRPGGDKNPHNPASKIGPWLHYYQLLNRFLAIADPTFARNSPVASSGRTENPFELLNEIAAVGERVDLRLPIDEGRVTSLTVEPKGMMALVEIDELDRDCRWLGARLATLIELADEGLATAGDLQAQSDCARRITDYVSRIVWILTTPGAWCPYDPEADADPAAPAYLRDIDSFDLTRLLVAHRRVNGEADATLALYLPKRSQQEQTPLMSWSVFYAATAREINVDSEVLLKHWSRKKVVVQAVLAAKARLDAEERAKATAAAA